jgi:Rrf2 family protein
MKLSTKTRYGTRFMLELAQRYGEGFVQLRDTAQRQQISLKYLEQIVIPLKRAQYITAIRGARGGYRLARPPHEITMGEIVGLLEDGRALIECVVDPDVCDRSQDCLTRELWKETTDVMFEKLDGITLTDLLAKTKTTKSPNPI